MFEATELTLEAWTKTAWAELSLAAGNLSHPWSHMVLGTVSENGPRQRTVILRAIDVERERLWFHTDRRSPKIAELQKDHRVSCLFYDSKSKLQLTITGTALLHLEDAIADEHWAKIPFDSRRNYLGVQPPGNIAGVEPSTNLPVVLPESGLTSEQTKGGRDQFAVVEIQAQSWEILQLRRSGNLRAKFGTTSNCWVGSWIEP